ncbi:hypothetical protein NMG60_11013370 [Bertholletia excelsa]
MSLLRSFLSIAMNARTVGAGDETVVLAQGYGGKQPAWDNIVARLAQNYKVVLVDWSLFGAMNLKSTVFIGHSMSGMIGCIASIKRPELCRRLELVGASPRYINSSLDSNYLHCTSFMASFLIGADDPFAQEKYQKSLLKMNPETAISVAEVFFLSDYRDILEKAETPCTIIQTTTDPVVPGSVADFMQKKIKANRTVKIIETFGHMPHFIAHLQLPEILSRVLGFNL